MLFHWASRHFVLTLPHHIIAGMRRNTWLVVPAVLLFFWLALDSMVMDSPTMDEQNHLARGVAFLRTGDPRLSLEHPPLVNTLSALPLLTVPGIRLPTDHPSWSRPEGWYEFADLLLWEYNDDVTRMIFLARLPIVFLGLSLALVAFHFARLLWPTPAALVAFYALLLDPNILAHARYTTTDLGGTTFLLLAVFAVWWLWQTPETRLGRLLLVGLALGLAFSSKLSALAFGPILALMAFLPLYPVPWNWRNAGRRLASLAAASVLALLVVWLVYGLQWGPLEPRSGALAALEGLTLPMPTFWAGIEQILLLSGGGRPAFLLGETSATGFAAYFPLAFAVKTPLATLGLFILALIVFARGNVTASFRRRAAFLLAPALLYFLLSVQSRLNIGYRHLLPALPFLYILIAGAVAILWQRQDEASPQTGSLGSRLLPTIAVVLLVALPLGTVAIHPHYLSYFNLLAGGPENGYRILVDSNVDWGQDLLRLKQWMAENRVAEVKLSWFGTADPAYYGIKYEPLPGLPRHFDLWWDVPFDPQAPPDGVYAISVSNLWELPLQEEKYVFPWFRARQPDHRVGYSVLIYEVD